MKLNRKWILVIALIMSVAMATTGTLAYLTSEDSAVNVMTLGNVEIEQLENGKKDGGFKQGQPLYPAYYTTNTPWDDPNAKGIVEKTVTVENIGSSAAYVRTWFAFEAGELTWDQFRTNFLLQLNETGAWDWQWDEANKYTISEQNGEGKYFIALATLKTALPVDEKTEPSLIQLAMAKEATNEIVTAIGDSYNVLVLSQAMQTVNFENVTAAEALAIGFGDQDGALGVNHPWTDGIVIPSNPYAQVTTLGENDMLTNSEGTVIFDKNRMVDTTESNMGLDVGKIPLDIAYQFEPTMTSEEGKASEYANWHADFVVSVNKDIPPYGIGLAGYYDAWCSLNNDKWVMLASPAEIEAGEEIRSVDALGGGNLTVAYKELCEYGNDGIGFLCGAVALEGKTIDGHTVEAIPEGTVLNVELRLYEATDSTRASETGEYVTTGTYTYHFK